MMYLFLDNWAKSLLLFWNYLARYIVLNTQSNLPMATMSMQTSFFRAFEAIKRRGCVANSTPNLASAIDALLRATKNSAQPVSVYAGFDPTAPSLHLGHAAVALSLRRLQDVGIRPIALVGGATALIGDPSGKSVDRPFLDEEAVHRNCQGIQRSLESLIDFNASSSSISGPTSGALLVNNADFYKDKNTLQFMREVGSHFRLGNLLARETVRTRMGWNDSKSEGNTSSAPAGGMSWTEFSYSLFQAHDYYTLHKNYGAVLQVGGSDQWGNIIAGVDYIRRRLAREDEQVHLHSPDHVASPVLAGEAHALTVPLLTNAAGQKFGKSEGNVAIWINSDLTSHFEMYQYLLRVNDTEIEKLLYQLTLLPDETIYNVTMEHAKQPEKKVAQLLLADTLTGMLRGQSAVASAKRTSALLYGNSGIWSQKDHDGKSAGNEPNGIDNAIDTSKGTYLPQRLMIHELNSDDVLSLTSSGEIQLCTLPFSTVFLGMDYELSFGAETQTGGANTAAISMEDDSNGGKLQALQAANGPKGVLIRNSGSPISVIDCMIACKLASSKAEARRLIEGGGVYWNWERVHPGEGSWRSNSIQVNDKKGKDKGPLAIRRVNPDGSDFIGPSQSSASKDLVAVLSLGKKKNAVLRVIV